MSCAKSLRLDSSGLLKANQSELFQDFNNLLGICAHPIIVPKKSIVQRRNEAMSDMSDSDDSSSEPKASTSKSNYSDS